jgi:hypothetical protein
MKKLFWMGCVGGSLAAGGVSAQPAGDGKRGPEVTAEFSVGGSRGVKMEDGRGGHHSMRTFEQTAEVEYAIAAGGKRPTIYKLGIEWERTEFGGWDDGHWPETLQSVGLEVSRMDIWGPKWMSLVAVSPGWHSAGAGTVDGDAFGVQGLALARYSVRENLHVWVGGFGNSLADGSDRFNPVMGVEWTVSPQWQVSIGMPETGVTYRVSERFTIGAGADVKSGVYAVEETFLLGVGRPVDATLEYLDVRAGVNAEWRMNERVSVGLEVGTVLMRRIEYSEGEPGLRSDAKGVGGILGALSGKISF